jgi:hypothetical protein
MKAIRVFTVAIGITCASILIYGCCQMYCNKSEFPLLLLNFNREDVDTVVFVKYQPGGQFTNKIDSFYEYLPQYAPGVPQFDSIIHYVYDLDLGKDWEIKLPGLESVYRVSDLQTGKDYCPCGPGATHVVTGYRLQGGNLLYGKYVEIRK